MKIRFFDKEDNVEASSGFGEFFIDSDGDVIEIIPREYGSSDYHWRQDIEWEVVDS